MFEIIPKKTNIDFIGKRYYALAISGILVILGILAMVQIFAFGKANLGIEFTGGTSVTIKFEKPIKIDDARKALERNGVTAQLQDIRGENKLLIRVKKASAIEEDMANKIIGIFTREFPENKIAEEEVNGTKTRAISITEIGPTIGRELRSKAILAILGAVAGLLIYIAFRFDFKFGVAATVATFHDVLAVLGIIYILNKEINLLIMTALLTLAGYSLTDTVVIFDRIRENIKLRHREPLPKVINASINQILSRTSITSLTTLLVIVAIFIWGGEVLHDLSFALMLGIIIGTYSSWFVASPLLLLWKGRRGKLLRQARRI